MLDLLHFEKAARERGYRRIAGIDEAGRGPLAGPVVAAAVILPISFEPDGLTDSKRLTARRREFFFDRILKEAVAVEVAQADCEQIERLNILQATRVAMAAAVQGIDPPPDYILVDGIHEVPFPLPQAPLPKGDARSASIAAASVIAKVTRDRLMVEYDRRYPLYGFALHKGYPTRAHREAIRRLGPCPIHRRGFKGVREYLDG